MNGRNLPTCVYYIHTCTPTRELNLLFMGNEFGQTSEWNYKSELDWELLQYDPHNKLQECVRDIESYVQR